MTNNDPKNSENGRDLKAESSFENSLSENQPSNSNNAQKNAVLVEDKGVRESAVWGATKPKVKNGNVSDISD